MSSSISPLTFTGVSSFSDDFQAIMSRAVAIAQLPVKLLENQQSDLLQQKMLAGNFSATVSALAESVHSLGQLGATRGITGSSSNSSKVSVVSTTASSTASYAITNITSVAAAAAATSAQGYATGDSTPVSSSPTREIKLVVGSTTKTFNLAADKNNLAGLRDAINASGLGVTASILTTGTGANPNYLSLTANSTGAQKLQVIDDPNGTPTQLLQTKSSQKYIFGTVATAGTVTSVGEYATADSTPVSNSPTREMTLTVGSSSSTFTLDADKNNLNGLRDAINNASLGVTASITTTGGGQSQLTLTSDTVGAKTIQLVDDPNGTPTQFLNESDLQYTFGANAEFDLNGVHVTSSTNVINNVVPGVTFKVLDTSDSVTLTLGLDRSKMISPLNNLVAKYNALQELVDGQIGKDAGLLTGNNLVRSIQDAMRSLTKSIGSGRVQSLGALGIEISKEGVMSFNQDTFDALSDSDVLSGFDLMGSETTGLGALEDSFTEISDPITGLIQKQIEQWDKSDTRLTSQISTMNERIENMQAALNAKLQWADTLLAALESQQNILTASIDSLYYTTYGRETS